MAKKILKKAQVGLNTISGRAPVIKSKTSINDKTGNRVQKSKVLNYKDEPAKIVSTNYNPDTDQYGSRQSYKTGVGQAIGYIKAKRALNQEKKGGTIKKKK
jgi:hypothetical protein